MSERSFTSLKNDGDMPTGYGHGLRRCPTLNFHGLPILTPFPEQIGLQRPSCGLFRESVASVLAFPFTIKSSPLMIDQIPRREPLGPKEVKPPRAPTPVAAVQGHRTSWDLTVRNSKIRGGGSGLSTAPPPRAPADPPRDSLAEARPPARKGGVLPDRASPEGLPGLRLARSPRERRPARKGTPAVGRTPASERTVWAGQPFILYARPPAWVLLTPLIMKARFLSSTFSSSYTPTSMNSDFLYASYGNASTAMFGIPGTDHRRVA